MRLDETIGETPLVELPWLSRGCRVPILGKAEHLNPGGSVKDRIARAIVLDAEARGVLRPGMTLIEATAGNTGFGLALVAASRGYALVCVLPEKMAVDKRQALAAAGAKVIVTPNAPPSDPRNFQNVARRLAQRHGWFLTEQFTNPANPAIHESTTGPEIWRQTGGQLGAFVAGVGTGGTITGVGRFLRRVGSSSRIVLADPYGSRLAHLVEPHRWPDLEAPYAVEGIGGSVVPGNLDLSLVHQAEVVSDTESFAMTAQLIRHEGLFVGGSTGTLAVAAQRVARQRGVNGPVVMILCDSWDRYRQQPWMQQIIAQQGSIRLATAAELVD
ncbi:MAG: cysteine synthase family protein [Gemmataceae bacterium]